MALSNMIKYMEFGEADGVDSVMRNGISTLTVSSVALCTYRKGIKHN